MYVSHPVRRLRDNPTPGESVDLIITTAEGTETDDLAQRLETAGATVTDRLQFGAVQVTVPEPLLSEICTREGIESIETTATRDVAGGDAGEDL